MKANAFREQVALLGRWFKEWNECEQTVAIYSLLKKSTPVQAKFLDQVLQQSLAECCDVKQLEAKANDEEFLRSLRTIEKERVIHQLLQLLPLLQVGQSSAKAAYLELIPDLLSHTLHNGVNVEESRQLLSFSLIHPAISAEERRKLHSWMACLEERFTYNPAPGGNTSSSSSSNKSSNNNLSVNHSQSHSPSPASSSQHSITHMSPDLPVSQEYTNLMVPSAAPSHGYSSPSPVISTGTHMSWQQVQQSHSHVPYSGFDASAAINPPASNGETSGCSQFVSPANGHATLRATNSHAGAFGASQGHISLHPTSSAPPNFTSLPPSTPVSQGSGQKHHAPLRRTTSVVPPGRYQNSEKTVSDWLNTNYDHQGGGQQQLYPSQNVHPILASRHFPQGDHAPLSPQSSVTSSGSSDSHHEDGPQLRDIFLEEGSGMREVPVWLKTLRLHKYAYLFRQMEYEDMLNLTEDWLMQQNVTKGARHKFMININKLKERQELLRKLEKSIMEERGSIKSALGEMKAMLNTPIKAYNPSHSQLVPSKNSLSAAVSSGQSSVTSSTDGPLTSSSSSSTSTSTPQSPSSDEVADGDLPGQFCRLMGKVCQQLLVASRPDDECFQLYLQLIDKCLNHEAFSDRQKKLLQSRKQSAQKIWQPPPQKNGDRQRRSFWGNTFPFGNSIAARTIPRSGRGGVPLSAQQQQQLHSGVQQWSFGSKRSILGSASNSHMPLQRNSSLNTSYFNKPGLLEQQTKQSVSRTHSAPINQPLSLPLQCGDNSNDTEINARLDSLCISMTEHALGSSDAPDRGSAY